MATFLPLLALGGLIVAAFFWDRARGASIKLRTAQIELGNVQTQLQELRDSKEQKSTKEKSRKSEVEELREKVRDLKAKATEAQEQAQRARDVEKARREFRGGGEGCACPSSRGAGGVCQRGQGGARRGSHSASTAGRRRR